MKLLILGGTRFAGRHIVESALKRGHTVTLFNRGRENLDLFPGVEKLIGDRYSDLDLLRGREWDAVIDTCGYEPKAVRLSAELLKDSVEQCIYISSGSVYEDWEKGKLDEASQVKVLSDEATTEVDQLVAKGSPDARALGKYYGELKAACEMEIDAILPGRALHVRSGVMVGPYDYTGRFTYWIDRIARGGRVVCPDCPETPLRFIDARDLADWIIQSAEQKITGVFNTWGNASFAFGEFLNACQVSDKDPAELVWITEQQLSDNEVQPWSDLPLWLPSEYKAYFNATDEKAIQRGLTYRSIEETIQNTRSWLEEHKFESKDSEGLSGERELQILSKFPG